MISDKAYKVLKDKYACYSSWALWDIADVSKTIHTKELSIEPFLKDLEKPKYRHNTLNSNAILLGSNMGKDSNSNFDWSNFHNGSTRIRDYNTTRMILNTPFVGSYMTDIIKNDPGTSPGIIKTVLEPKNHEKLIQNTKMLQEEFDLIQPKFVLVFGTTAEKAFTKIMKDKLLNTHGAKHIHMLHWAAPKKRLKILLQKQIN